MRAYQLTEWQHPPELREVPVPEPGPGQVLIKVGGAGACHSDLHLMEWPPGTMGFDPPFTLGHENAGWVEMLGAGAFGGGLGLDGGMAEYMLVPSARLLLPLGDIDPRDAAPLTDAGLTPYHAIKRSLHLLTPGATAVVIGVGGLGHMAVQMLRALSSAQVIAVDTSADKLALAADVGADRTVQPGPDAVTQIRELTQDVGARLVLDVVGSDDTLALAAQILSFESHVTVIGLAGGTLTYGFGALPWEAQLTLTYWGSSAELGEVLELRRAGAIKPHVERFPLDRVDEAYERMRAGTLQGRAVICPND